MIILILFIILFFLIFITNEKYSEIDESQYIDYKVIHLKDSCKKKMQNIKNNEKKIGKKINIFDAVNGKNINITTLNTIDPDIKLNYKFKTKAELGCYLSHLMLYKNAINSIKKYTVIFEDDFEIVSDDLNKKILEITKNLDDKFDLVYLGNLYDSKSKKVKNNIYKKSNTIPLYGCHAMLLNNKNAKKIYDYLKNINDTVDKNLEKLMNENKINNYVIYPSLVNQNNNFESTLRPYYEIIRRQIVQEIINIYNKLFD